MGVLLTTAAALVVWVLLWGLGAKAFDASLLALMMVLVAATAHIVAPFLPGNKDAEEDHPDPAPFN